MDEQQSFGQHVAQINSEWMTCFDLAMDLQFFDDPSQHLTEINNSIAWVNDLIDSISRFLDGLPTDIADFLDSLGYDSASYRGVPYYKNPFEHAFWESLNLGMPNSMNEIMFHSKALEAHIAFTKLRFQTNNQATRAELEVLKSELSELASSLIYHD